MELNIYCVSMTQTWKSTHLHFDCALLVKAVTNTCQIQGQRTWTLLLDDRRHHCSHLWKIKFATPTLHSCFHFLFSFFSLSLWYLLRSRSSKFHSNKIYCTFPCMFAFLTSYLKSPSLKFIKQCSYMFSKKFNGKVGTQIQVLNASGIRFGVWCEVQLTLPFSQKVNRQCPPLCERSFLCLQRSCHRSSFCVFKDLFLGSLFCFIALAVYHLCQHPLFLNFYGLMMS